MDSMQLPEGYGLARSVVQTSTMAEEKFWWNNLGPILGEVGCMYLELLIFLFTVYELFTWISVVGF